jgi:hypothetical protein
VLEVVIFDVKVPRLAEVLNVCTIEPVEVLVLREPVLEEVELEGAVLKELEIEELVLEAKFELVTALVVNVTLELEELELGELVLEEIEFRELEFRELELDILVELELWLCEMLELVEVFALDAAFELDEPVLNVVVGLEELKLEMLVLIGAVPDTLLELEEFVYNVLLELLEALLELGVNVLEVEVTKEL